MTKDYYMKLELNKIAWKLLKTQQTSLRHLKKLKGLMNKGKVNGALKLMTNSMPNEILPLSNKILGFLKQKHSEPTKS